MTNQEALTSLCNAMANTYYPDDSTVRLMLFNEQIEPLAEAKPKDKQLFKLAVSLVLGYVESSSNENGVSTSVREDAIKASIKHYCDVYEVDVDDMLGEDITTIENGTNLW